MYLSERLDFEWKFYALPIIVGFLAGVGAIIFKYMIAFFEKLLFEGELGFASDALKPLSSTWGNLVVLVPVVGFFLVSVIIHKGAPEAKGHGVPEVMTAVYADKGKIRPRVVGVKTIASALCIGSGGSAGEEGSIVQIGASIGSSVGQYLNLSGVETITLLGCGAAAGIAATFNAPLGGILFAVELILPELSVRTMVPLALSTSSATYLVRWALGDTPVLSVPHYTLNSGYELFFYALMGILMGVVSIIYIKVLYGIEDFFEKWKASPYLKHTLGGLLVGITGLLLFKLYGQYYIFGVGYSTLSGVVSGELDHSVIFLLLLVFVKIFATSMTLGSGGSGGIFAPALYIGACFGAAFGLFFHTLLPSVVAAPTAYANVGMGAIVGGVVGAPLTAIIMFFEMTRDYSIIVPLTVSVVVCRAFVHYNCDDGTIYEAKLLRNGIRIPHERAIDKLSIVPVKDVMDIYEEQKELPEIYQYSTVMDALMMMNERRVNELIVVGKSNKPKGVIKRDDIFYFYTRENMISRKNLR